MTAVTLWEWSCMAVPLIAACYLTMILMDGGGLKKASVLPKCTGSFVCAVTAGLAVLQGGGNPLAHPVFWALLLCMAGDYLIEQQMVAGGLAFAAGHIVLTVWALGQAPFHWVSLLIWATALAALTAYLYGCRRQMGGMALPLLLYGAILTADLAVAAVLPFTAGGAFWTLAAGLLSFVLSDAILGRNVFGEAKPWRSKLLMALYYLALYLIAATPWRI